MTEVTRGHRNICCDGCQRVEFGGRRYRCMSCMNYDLCGGCYDQGIETQDHSADHLMELIPEPGQELRIGQEPRVGQELRIGQEPRIHREPRLGLELGLVQERGGAMELINTSISYTCPYCYHVGYSAKQLLRHVYEQHSLSEDYVVCPMCAGVPADELLAIRNLSRHLLLHHVEQANEMEPDTPPLRRVLVRSSPRGRRRRTLPVHQFPRENPAGLAVDGATVVAFPNEVPSEPASPKQLGNGFLLGPWMAEQERRSRDTEPDVTEKTQRARFAEHLMLSMLSAEELQLPENKTPLEGSPKPQHELSKAMSLMSSPWARLRQVSQWEGGELRTTTVDGIEVDALKDQTAGMERAEPGTEEEEAID